MTNDKKTYVLYGAQVDDKGEVHISRVEQQEVGTAIEDIYAGKDGAFLLATLIKGAEYVKAVGGWGGAVFRVGLLVDVDRVRQKATAAATLGRIKSRIGEAPQVVPKSESIMSPTSQNGAKYDKYGRRLNKDGTVRKPMGRKKKEDAQKLGIVKPTPEPSKTVPDAQKAEIVKPTPEPSKTVPDAQKAEIVKPTPEPPKPGNEPFVLKATIEERKDGEKNGLTLKDVLPTTTVIYHNIRDNDRDAARHMSEYVKANQAADRVTRERAELEQERESVLKRVESIDIQIKHRRSEGEAFLKNVEEAARQIANLLGGGKQ